MLYMNRNGGCWVQVIWRWRTQTIPGGPDFLFREWTYCASDATLVSSRRGKTPVVTQQWAHSMVVNIAVGPWRIKSQIVLIKVGRVLTFYGINFFYCVTIGTFPFLGAFFFQLFSASLLALIFVLRTFSRENFCLGAVLAKFLNCGTRDGFKLCATPILYQPLCYPTIDWLMNRVYLACFSLLFFWKPFHLQWSLLFHTTYFINSWDRLSGVWRVYVREVSIFKMYKV